MFRNVIFCIIACLPFFVFAQEPSSMDGVQSTSATVQSTQDKVKDKMIEVTDKISDAFNSGKDQVGAALGQSRLIRQNSNYFATLNYSSIDLVLPSKWGVTLGSVKDVDQTWELEYLKSSVSVPFIVEDLGEMTDERLSLIRRNYLGTQTFNFNYGLNYHRFNLHIGNKYLSSVATSVPDVDLISVESLGFNVGMGNRWTFSNHWIVGVDWVSWSQPVFTTRKDNKFEDYSANEGYKDSANTLVKLITWIPRITILKLQVGYSF